MKTIFRYFIPVLICFPFFANAQLSENKNSLDGKTFSIKIQKTSGEIKGWNWDKDELSFENGKLKSKFMSEKEKFSPAEIILTPDSLQKSMRFECLSENHPGISQIIWDGTITGNKMEGTAEWNNAKGKRTYTFTGSMKKQ